MYSRQKVLMADLIKLDVKLNSWKSQLHLVWVFVYSSKTVLNISYGLKICLLFGKDICQFFF